MQPTYRISIAGGEPELLQDAGLQLGALVERHLACSTLTLVQPRRNGEAMKIQPEDSVKLYVNGRCVFVGEATQDPRHNYSDTVTTTTYTVQNWWRRAERQGWLRGPAGRVEIGEDFLWLDGNTYKMGYQDDSGTTPATKAAIRFYTARTKLFAGHPANTSIVVCAQGHALLLSLLERHPGLLTVPDFPWPFGVYAVPPYVVADASIAQALIAVMRQVPTGVLRTQYDGGEVVLEAVDGAAVTPRAFALGAEPVVGAQVGPQGDLRPAGIHIRIGKAEFRLDYGQGFQEMDMFSTPSWYPEATRMDDYNMMTLSLDQSAYTEAPLGGIAMYLYEQLSVLAGSGQVSFHDPGLGLRLQLGEQLQLTGDGEVEHGRLLIQQVAHDFNTLRTTCTVGFPGPLQLGDLISRAQWIAQNIWGGARPVAITRYL